MKQITILKTWAAVAAALFVISSASAGEEMWMTDFAKAKQSAATNNLPILADFSGSDWCGWCIKLDNEVFSKKEFKAYAKDNLVLFLADFPQQKKQSAKVKAQNQELAQKFGVNGFPTVLLLSSKGEVLAKTGYQKGGAKAYVKHIKELVKQAKSAGSEFVKKSSCCAPGS